MNDKKFRGNWSTRFSKIRKTDGQTDAATLYIEVTYHFLLVVCSNDAIWHRFRDITKFTLYVTGCDLEKSFIFKKTVETTSHVRFLIHT